MNTNSTWRERYSGKLTSASRALDHVNPGSRIGIGNITHPLTLTGALAERKSQLRDISIHQNYVVVPGDPWWADPAWQEIVHPVTDFVGAATRAGSDARLVDFLPWDYPNIPKADEEQVTPPRHRHFEFDVGLVKISPPDADGMCSFGHAPWYNIDIARRSTLLIGEIDESFIRTPGDNAISVDDVQFLVESTAASAFVLTPPPPEEERGVVEVIGYHVSTLIQDGDTIQIGHGSISEWTISQLTGHHDLGMHSEIIPPGIVDLVKAGVLTGTKKTIKPGKIVSSYLVDFGEALPWADGNPMIELRSVIDVNNIRTIAAHDNLVSVNSILAIDLTGQVCSETIGPRLFGGVGGQFDFVVGSTLSRGGRSILVMPSTAGGGRISRVMPMFEAGTAVSVPRQWVDYIVTEYGVANLQGKTYRERAEELIGIAHPDFHEELRKAARARFWP